MICPKCKADTKVVNSRPHADDPTVIQRRRACEGCGHRFNTQEGTVDIVARRRLMRASRAKWRAAKRQAESHERQIRKFVEGEVAASGRPRAVVRQAAGLPARASRASNLNP